MGAAEWIVACVLAALLGLAGYVVLGGRIRRDTSGEDRAVKHGRAEGKARVSLVPPSGVLAVAEVMTYGERKYSAWNYLSGDGLPYSDYLDAAHRHMLLYELGEDCDQESGLPHLAHAAACLLMLIEMARVHPSQDDRCRRLS